MTFTIGRGNEVCVAAINALAHHVVGRTLESIVADIGRLSSRAHQRQPAALARSGEGRHPSRHRRDRQRGVGSVGEGRVQTGVEAGRRHDTGATHRLRGLPLSHRRPDTGRARCRCSSATPSSKAAREAEMRRDGYPAYITSAGWLGYPEDKVRRSVPRGARRRMDALQGEGRASTSPSDIRRCEVMREEIGWDCELMADANQVWDVRQAIEWMRAARALQAALDRGADQPRRRARPRDDPPRGRADRRRHRRALRQQGDVQAAPAGRRHRLLPGRRLPPRRPQRGARRAVARRASSACRCARTPAASACASTCNTSRSSTTSASALASTTA